MAILCSLQITGDYAVITADHGPQNILRFDMTKPCCRMYESARQQGKEYLEEIVKWCGENPANSESILRSILLYLMARRRQMGLAM